MFTINRDWYFAYNTRDGQNEVYLNFCRQTITACSGKRGIYYVETSTSYKCYVMLGTWESVYGQSTTYLNSNLKFCMNKIGTAVMLTDKDIPNYHLLMVDSTKYLNFMNFTAQNGHYYLIMETKYLHESQVEKHEISEEKNMQVTSAESS